MTKVFVLLLFAFFAFAPRASAQSVEASASVGFTTSEGIETDTPVFIGQFFDEATVDSGQSFNFTVGFFATPHVEVEFLWSQQTSEFGADGPGGALAISDMKIVNYFGNFVYNWGEGDARMRPFMFGGFGATSYRFGDFLIAVPAGTPEIDSSTRFATNWGGGVKYYFGPAVGVRVAARWTPTYIRSETDGIWCGYYGCWTIPDLDYSNQFEFSGGVTVRF